ncbi:SDR family oxidoreductase [Falsirhodobacter halotolerans]|uniref:SDR family oxidoreductase n=1 Tax=Falsirhodobacter halotolerans TaxID=1146892 RepID=UPI001FD278C6|nr:SDR family NAD(P)-dependent oxidoreductase [Falsirhodobacter halotolerans]MCJ8140630.1 SDR family oxidoreductase [Falsirhodobacter halotolerans]
MDMTGKVVAITGAGRGIGLAAAQAFAAAGAQVVMLGRDTGALARHAPAGASTLACDVADWDHVQAAVADIAARHGRLDVWINNAGTIDPIGPLATADPTDWARAIDVNLKGVFHGFRAVLPVMRAQGGGTVLTVGSGAAHRPLDGWSAYCTAKAGALMLTRAAHLEEAEHGLRAISLSPGTVATDMQRRIKQSGINAVSQIDFADHVPPEWPARTLVWMCGPGGDAWLGAEVSLRDATIRAAVGLA